MDQTSYVLEDSENQTFKLFVIGYLLGVGKPPCSCSSVTFYFCHSKVELIILIKKKKVTAVYLKFYLLWQTLVNGAQRRKSSITYSGMEIRFFYFFTNTDSSSKEQWQCRTVAPSSGSVQLSRKGLFETVIVAYILCVWEISKNTSFFMQFV